MNKLTLKYCVLFGIIVTINFAKAQDRYLINYTTSNGLISNTCYNMLQASNGLIYIGSNKGYSTFDGSIFENKNLSNGCPDLDILNFMEDEQKRIWFGTYNTEIGYEYDFKIYSSLTDKIPKKDNRLPTHKIFQLDKNAFLGVNTNLENPLFLIKREDSLNYTGLSFASINNCKLIENTVYVLTSNRLYLFKKGNYKKAYRVVRLDNISFNHTEITNDGDILLLKDKSTIEILKKADNYKSKTILNSKTTFLRFKLIGNELFVVLAGGGAQKYLLENNQLTFIETILPNISINNIIKDKDKNYYFSTPENGLYVLKAWTKNNIEKKNSPTEGDLFNIATVDNYIFTTNSKGELCKYNTNLVLLQKKIFNFNMKGLRNAFPVISFNKKLYLNADNNLYEVNINQLTLKKVNVTIYSTFKFIKTYSKGIFSNGATNLNIYNEQQGFSAVFTLPQVTLAANIDNQDNIWYTQENNLYCKYKNEPLPKKVEVPNLPKINYINHHNNQMLLSTAGSGLMIIENNKIIQTINFNITNNTCYKSLVYGNKFYILTDEAIIELKVENGQWILNNYFNIINNNANPRIYDFTVDNNFIYALSNLSIYKIGLEAANKAKPSFIFTTYKYNNITFSLQDTNINLTYNSDNLFINYRLIDFAFGNVLNIQYTINNKEWITAKNNQIVISNLNQNDIALNIRVVDLQNKVILKKAIKINVNRPFWMQKWFFPLIIALGIILISLLALSYFQRKNRAEIQKLNLQSKMLRLEQQAGQSLMHPHFVFNVLNSIQNFINQNKRKEAVKYLTNFAKLIRLNLQHSTESSIDIDLELEILEKYLGLEAMRIGDTFSFKFNFDERLSENEIKIPSMILQPIIENAIWHGLGSKETDKIVEINLLYIDAKTLQVQIIDNGKGLLEKTYENEERRGIAIKNIKNRLAIYSKQLGIVYQVNYKIAFPENKEFPGTKVEINLPILE